MTNFPCLIRSATTAGETRFALGDPLVDRYLEFVAGRALPNTVRAVAFDLKAFFRVIGKSPVAVTPSDVFEFELEDPVRGRKITHRYSISTLPVLG